MCCAGVRVSECVVCVVLVSDVSECVVCVVLVSDVSECVVCVVLVSDVSECVVCVVLVSDAGAGVSVSSGTQCRGLRASGALRAEPLGV